MRFQYTLLATMATLISLTLVQAMFFTSSRENDYPRLGKRLQPLSKYVYKKWLRLSDSRNVYSYDPGSREMLHSRLPLRDMGGFKDDENSDLLEAEGNLDTTDVDKRDSFYKTLQFYLSLAPVHEFFNPLPN